MSKAQQYLSILPILLFTLLISNTSSAMTNLNTNAPTSIAAYTGKGHWTIMQAWMSNCAICNKEMPEFVKKAPRFPNTKVISISLDGNKQRAQQFITKHRVNFPTILTNTQEFNNYLLQAADEKLTGTPTYLIFDPRGTLVAVQQGHVPFGSIYNFITSQQ